MSKKRKSKIFIRSSMLSQTRGQFYLIATIIIVVVVVSLGVVSNYSKKSEIVVSDDLGKKLDIESEKVLDYGIKNNKNTKELLKNFTKTYSTYLSAESSYFIFGNKTEVTFAGYKKLDSSIVYIDVGLGDQELNLVKETYNSLDLSSPTENIKVTIDNIDYNFNIKKGENFHFVISREINGEKFIFTK
jgi:hypothetical protein